MTDPDIVSKSLVIWDMDGTLINSYAVITESMIEAFQKCELTPPNPKDVAQIVGLSLPFGIAQLAPGKSSEILANLEQAYRDAFFRRRTQPDFEEPLFDGMLDLVQSIDEMGVHQAIATGKSRRGLDTVIAHHGFDRWISFSICADDGPSKPNPFMIERCLEFFGEEKRRAIMIGDTGHDLLMAKNAGIDSVAVTWGFHEREFLRACDPAFMVDDTRQLTAIVSKLASC